MPADAGLFYRGIGVGAQREKLPVSRGLELRGEGEGLLGAPGVGIHQHRIVVEVVHGGLAAAFELDIGRKPPAEGAATGILGRHYAGRTLPGEHYPTGAPE